MAETVSPSAVGSYRALAQLGGADIAIHQDRCLMVRNRNAGCQKCVQACTSECITYRNGGLAVDKSRCVGCGTCATVCPTCAIEARNPSDAELISQGLAAGAANHGTVVVACEKALAEVGLSLGDVVSQDAVAGVVCLGRVDESFLACMAEHGMGSALLARGTCETCEHATGYRTAEAVCETTQTLMAAWGSSFEVSLVRGLPESTLELLPAVVSAGEPVPSHAAEPLASVTAKASDTAGSSDAAGSSDGAEASDVVGPLDSAELPKPRFLKVMDDGTLPHFVPDRRERLLDSLAALGEPREGELATRLWGHVVIDVQKCSSCRMCATFCPTGAIRKFDDVDGTIGLIHYAGDCVKCLCCQNICREQAIRVEDGVLASDIMGGEGMRVELRPVAVRKGTPEGMASAMRALLGMEEVFDR